MGGREEEWGGPAWRERMIVGIGGSGGGFQLRRLISGLSLLLQIGKLCSRAIPIPVQERES